MGAIKGFEQLSKELPDEERKDLLKDITDDLKIYPEENTGENDDSSIPLKTERDADADAEGSLSDHRYAEKVYKKIPVFERLLLFFLRVFTGKTLQEVLEIHLLRKLGKEIDSKYPALVDPKSGKLKEGFYNEISILNASLDIFREPVNFINKNRISEFYRFAARKEMAGFEEDLLNKTDPEKLYELGENKDIASLKTEILKQFEQTLESIEPEEKREMYEISKSFFYLSQAVNFPFDHLKKMFLIEPNGNRFCIFGNARKQLGQLDSLLASMTVEMLQFDKLCDHLFDFYIANNEVREKAGTTELPDDNYSARVRNKALSALNQVFSFRKTVPLTKILKVMYKNLDYKPEKYSGGEEWFNIYRKMLRDEIEEKGESYIYRLKKKNVLKRLKSHVPEIPAEEKYFFSVKHNDNVYPLTKCSLLYFLNLFYLKFYLPKIEKVVSTIMLDGNFYKETNRKELNESFNLINEFSEKYKSFEERTRFREEAAKERQEFPGEEPPVMGRRKNIDNYAKTMNKEGYKLYRTFFEAFVSVKNILGGITSGTASGKYDTLSNLSVVCEEKTSMSVASIDRLYRQLSDILNIFNDYDELVKDNE